MFAKLALSVSLLVGYALGANHTVLVGSGGLRYTPNNITAAVGDLVTFVFVAGMHSVTQSSFAAPCVKLTNATVNGTGFDSGMYPVAANATSYPTWTLNVSTAAPIWYYCKTGTHCQSGMVGAINAPNGTFPMYLANALNTSTALNATMIAANATGSGIGARPIATSSIAPSQASAVPRKRMLF